MILFPLLVLGLVSGAAATLQNARHAPPHRSTPRSLTPLSAALAGAAVCGILLAVVPRSASSQAISPSVLAELPALRASGFEFDQQEIHVRAGEPVALRLDNTDNMTHTFTVDEFGVDVPIVPGQPSVALFVPKQPGS